MSGEARLGLPSGEGDSPSQESFSLAALHANIRKTLQYQLSDAAELAWMRTLDAALSMEPELEPDYQAACLQTARTGLLTEKLPKAVATTKESWINYIAESYPADINTGGKLPNPNRQAQERNLDQATVVAAHSRVIDRSRQALLQSVQDSDPLETATLKTGLVKAIGDNSAPVAHTEAVPEKTGDDFEESIDQALTTVLTGLQSELAAQALAECSKIQAILPVKSGPRRLGASVLKHSRLKVVPAGKDKTSHEANRAIRKLVDVLNKLADPKHLGTAAANNISADFIDTRLGLASHYGRMVTTAKSQLAEQLEQVPVNFAIPRPQRKPRPPRPSPAPSPASQPAQPVEKSPAPAPEVTEEAPAEEAVPPVIEEPAAEETPQAEQVKVPTAAEIRVKKLYTEALEKYFDIFSRREFRRPELTQVAGVLRRTPDTANKACLFVVLASFSGDNRAIHDAFATIENMSVDRHLRGPLYGLCYQAYARTRSMPEQTVYALARQANPEAHLPHNRDQFIRPGTAFTDDIGELSESDSAIVEVTTRVDRETLAQLLGELNILFPEPIRQATNADVPPSGERRQRTYVQLPALQVARVRSVLLRLGCEIDLSGGKGSHAKVVNPATGGYTTLHSKRADLDPNSLRNDLASLGITPEEFIRAMND